ncbi:hypothetical protein LTR84_005483 [Exophiala bonariae]|uniref:Uncharacterized protein n=1 Tax=Exophiala bonariae TaxID=1690606 RepID=A0AAV9N6V1_9EURO|nr:hypothetical protein LTR84_005483 [Exophiala bonariae]
MHSSVTPDDCQALHGLQHRTSISRIAVGDEERQEDRERRVQNEDRSISPFSHYNDRRMINTHPPVKPLHTQTTAPASSWHTLAAKPGRITRNMLHTTIQLVSLVLFCSFLIPYMHYSRTKMAAECEACKYNALADYEKGLAECEITTGANFTAEEGGKFLLSRLEVIAIMVLACIWQYVTWIVQDKLVTRLLCLTVKATN